MAVLLLIAAYLGVGALDSPSLLSLPSAEAASDSVAHFRRELYREETSVPVRVNWAVALLLDPHPHARDAVMESLRPTAPVTVRTAVCLAIGSEKLTARPSAEYELPTLACLLDADPALRRAAAEAVGRLATRSDSCLIDRLRVLLHDAAEPTELRVAVAEAIGHIPTRSAFLMLAELLTQRTVGATAPLDPALQSALLEGLQRITGRSDLTAIRPVREFLTETAALDDEGFADLARRVRVRRLEELAESNRALEEALTNAESALWEARPPEQRGAFLSDRLRHRQPCVRIWAAGKLTTLPDKDVDERMLTPLLEGLAHPDHPGVRAACATALPFVESRLTRMPGMAPLGPARLRAQLQSETAAETAAAMIAALSAYRVTTDVELFGRFLSDPRERVATAAATAFGELLRPNGNGHIGTMAAPTPAELAALRRSAERYRAVVLELTTPGDASPRSESLRVAALRSAVWLLRDDASLPGHVRGLAGDPSPLLRETVVGALEILPATDASVAALDKLSQDSNRRVRTAAVQALSTVSTPSLLPTVWAVLESRLSAEADPEVLERVIAALSGSLARAPVAEQLALADRFAKAGTGGRPRAAAEIRRRLLDTPEAITDSAQRRTLLAGLAELLEGLALYSDAAARHRQLAGLLRMAEMANPAATSARAAFRCGFLAKQYRETWGWVGEWLARPTEPLAQAVLEQVSAELSLALQNGQEQAVLDALAALPTEAAWTRAEPVRATLEPVRARADAQRLTRLRQEAANQLGVWLTAPPEQRTPLEVGLLAAVEFSSAAVLDRLEAELAKPAPDAATEAELMRLLTRLVAAWPKTGSGPAAPPIELKSYDAKAPPAERRKLISDWRKRLAAVSKM